MVVLLGLFLYLHFAVPLASPSVKSPVKSPSIHPVMPGSAPPSSQHGQTPDDKAPLAAPIVPGTMS